jgi:hypothetical protein
MKSVPTSVSASVVVVIDGTVPTGTFAESAVPAWKFSATAVTVTRNCWFRSSLVVV